MKKFFILLSLCILGMGCMNMEEEEIIIPKEAIRFRVIARSNTEEDQKIKMQVKESLQKDISKLLEKSQDIQTTRELLKKNQNHFKSIIENTLGKNKDSMGYKIHYGLNYFPKKVYKGVTYEEGYYESLVVTLGSGMGDNWWCVLFPPLCLLEENKNKTEVEYRSYVKELFDKYF